MKKFALSLILAGALASPAAAATISFTANTTTLPSYTSATVIQGFNQPTSNFAANSTNTTGTESLNGFYFSTATIVNSDPSMVGRFLELANGESYTLSFGNSPVQFLAFLIDSFRGSNNNSVTLTYSNNTTSSNILSSLSGLSTGSSGMVVVDREGGLGIKSIQFSSGFGSNTLRIDQIAVAAPEPATWGMMLLGFAVVGTQLRRRRKTALLPA